MKKKYALFGNNIKSSLSPQIHKALAEYYSVHLEYDIIESDNIDEILKILKSGKYSGANITHPHKIELIKEMDSVSDIVKECGALNTIKIENYKLIAYNTDVLGFLDVLALHNYSLHDKRVLVYGTGGVARAIINALLNSDIRTLLLDGRNSISKVELLNNFENKNKERMTVIYGSHGLICDLIINATNLGTAPESILSINLDRLSGEAVFDVVYNPVNTELLKKAKENKMITFSGIEMLILQAIRAFYIWYPQFRQVKTDFKLYDFVLKKLLLNKEL